MAMEHYRTIDPRPQYRISTIRSRGKSKGNNTASMVTPIDSRFLNTVSATNTNRSNASASIGIPGSLKMKLAAETSAMMDQ